MIIHHNISALNSHRQLGINNSSSSRNLEKLSTGYKINRAGDDAAGLAISEKMRGQIRGLTMASQNANNAVSLIQTAEGGLNETHSILQRMRELGVQSANGTYKDEVDRENIAKEVTVLKSEIDRIASSTHYNGIKLLDGSLGGINAAQLSDYFDLPAYSLGLNGFNYSLAITNVTGENLDGQEMTLIAGSDNQLYLQIGDKTYKQNVMGAALTMSNGAIVANNAFYDADGNTAFTADAGMGAAAPAGGVLRFKFTSGVRVDAASDFTFAVSSSQLIFQIGANGTADQRVGLHVDNMSTSFLGRSENDLLNNGIGTAEEPNTIFDIDVFRRENANAAIEVIDAAINQVSGTRADLGALQNRLEHTIDNLGTTRENLQAAESSIRDVDMAKEMMEFTKNNILVQASQSMLAQANQLPQGILQLLR